MSEAHPTTAPLKARRRALAMAAVLLAGIALSLAPGGVAPSSPDPGERDYTLTSRTIWSYYTEAVPSLDDPEDPVWDYPLQVLGLVPGHVAIAGGTSMEIRSVYTQTDIYMRIVWQDVVANDDPPRWVYHDGNWTFTSPFEDGVGLYFPISDPGGKFLDEGCNRTCHYMDWENPENQERKFTYDEGEVGDMWFWAAGITDPWDFAMDTYVTNTPSGNNVGYYEDPEMDLGLVKNRHLTEYMEYVYLSRPVYMQDPNKEPKFGPDFIARGEEVPFDQNYYDPFSGDSGVNPLTGEPWKNGDTVGGYLLDRMPTEGLGQIASRGSYDIQDQQWTVVLRRALDTGDPVHDVIFDDMTETYLFGISLFGDIMGGGDASAPFVEPEDEEEDRCVMNKVTKTIGLRFRPVVEAERVDAGEADSWDGQDWDGGTTVHWLELIHRSGEIHDPWDFFNVSAACDGDDLYLYLRHEDPNASDEYSVDVVWLMPSVVDTEETFHTLDWFDELGHMALEEGTADLWAWEWHQGGEEHGQSMDMLAMDRTVQPDSNGSQDLDVRTWREGGSRHVVFRRALDTGNDDDLAFRDLARTYVMRVSVHTSDRGEVLISYPMTAGFRPDPSDSTPPKAVTGLAVSDGADSDVHVSWDPVTASDFAQYRVYLFEGGLGDLTATLPRARVSDINLTSVRLTGIEPGVTYTVAVLAMDDNRNAVSDPPTATVAVTDTTAPARPSQVKAFDNLDSDVLVTWRTGGEPDIDHYEVYLETSPVDGAEGLEPVATVRGKRTSSFRIGGLDVGTTYHAAVVAVDWAGNALRNVTSASATPTDVTAPSEVRGLDSSTPQEPDSEGEVSLKWTASKAEDVASYSVYVSLTPIDSVVNFSPWTTVGAEQTSVVASGLNPGVKYYFAVTATDRSGHVSPSKYTVSARASSADPPEDVRGVVAVQTGEASARVSWMPVNVTGAPVVSYRVYMSEEPIVDLGAANVTLLGNATPGASPSLLATGLSQGVTYYFAVEAVDSSGRTSAGDPHMASVTIPVVVEEGPSLWERVGPPVTALSVIVIIALAAYVAYGRYRRYGRLLSRRPRLTRNGGGAT